MKVCYSPNLWGKEKGFRGFPQKVNLKFEHAGSEYCIPAIYRFSRGIVFDIITFLDEGKLREFFEKYKTSEENSTPEESTPENLTPLQKQSARQEHPYQPVQIREIYIDGKRRVLI